MKKDSLCVNDQKWILFYTVHLL